ncbi:UNVERIFIED_CONTAM: hypothetical protein Sradi_5120200 [Sesamum radiatum]|uniref:Sialate O-acetylesterase domain-containing protein n=1 Tax=Sesamum radiatum TaxID=300843 RepID=A0AAW2M3V0_SESRA
MGNSREPLHRDIDILKTCGIGGVFEFSSGEGLGHWGDWFGPLCHRWNEHKRVETWQPTLQSAADAGSGSVARWRRTNSGYSVVPRWRWLQGRAICRCRKAQLEIDLPNVKCVDAKGLQLQPDGLHLSTAAQVTVGRMMQTPSSRLWPLFLFRAAPTRPSTTLFRDGLWLCLNYC